MYTNSGIVKLAVIRYRVQSVSLGCLQQGQFEVKMFHTVCKLSFKNRKCACF